MNDMSPNTAVAERKAKPVEAVREALERLKPQLEMALPRHLTADRLLRVAMTAVQTTPKLLECDRTSLYRAVMMCAQLGLEPDGVLGQAYLIPFSGKVQFIPGYKGLLTLARNSGDVSSIAAHEVRENDTFKFDFASGDPPHHTFDLRSPRGDVIAFYAVARFKDGGLHWDMMAREEVEKIRDNSQGYRAALATAKKYSKEPDSPWINHFIEMGKKTIIRRIAKYLPMSVQKAAALADAYDTGRAVTLDARGELVIEGEATEADELAPAIEHKQSQLDRFEEQHANGEARPNSPAGDTQTSTSVGRDAVVGPTAGALAGTVVGKPRPDNASADPAGEHDMPDLLGGKPRSPAGHHHVQLDEPATAMAWDRWFFGLQKKIEAGIPKDEILRDNKDNLGIFAQVDEMRHDAIIRALEAK